MSDHLTRAKYLTQKGQEYVVIGILLGKQQGRHLEICNSLELKFKSSKGVEDRGTIDEGFCRERLDNYKKLFPELDPVGWYITGKNQTDAPSPAIGAIHKQFQQFVESPLLIILNPESEDARKKKALPIFIYECELAQSQFIRVDYSLATEDSERIAVDNVAKAVDSSTVATTSQLSSSMTAPLNALKVLRRKIKFLVDLVRNSPEVRANHNFMRKLQQICAQLPIANRADFEEHAFSEYADVSAVNLLGTVLKASEQLNSLCDDFKIYSQGNMGGGNMLGMEGMGDDEGGMGEMMGGHKPKRGGMMKYF